MRSILEQANGKELEFPKLMTNLDETLVIRFTEAAYGTVVYPMSNKYFFKYTSHWNANDFKDFKGNINLSN